MKRIVLVWGLVLVLGCLLSILAQAEEVDLEKIVVTPFRSGVSTFENPSAVSVINVDKQQQLGKFSLAEVVKHTAGVDYVVSGGVAGESSLFIRGADAYHTQLMLDEIKVYDPITPRGYYAFYNCLSLDNLDKIEITRGPFSSLYGSQSVGGSVSMFTHKGEGRPTISYAQRIGSYNTFEERFSSQGKIEKLAYSLGLSRLDVRSFYSARYKNGNHERDPFGNLNSSLRLDYEFNDNVEVGFSHRYTYAKYEYDGGWSVPEDDDDNNARFHQHIGSIYIAHKITEFLSQKFTYGLVDIQRRGWEGPDGWGGDGSYWYKGRSNQYKYTLGYSQTDFYKAILGYEYTGDSGESYWSPTKEPKHQLNSKGVFWENILRPFNNFFFSFTGRQERHSCFGGHFSYGLSSSYFVEPTKTKLKGSLATGFRAPSIYELFSSYGNRELKPERSRSFEFGFEQMLWSDKMSLGCVGFKNNIKNRIEWDSGSWKYYNSGEARIYGLENFLEYKPKDGLSVRFAYDYTHAVNKVDKSRLLRRAKNKFSLMLDAQCGNLRINPELFYVGNRIDSSNRKLKSYILANLAANYSINDNCEIFARVENILDYDYQNIYGYQTPRASFYTGFKLSF